MRQFHHRLLMFGEFLMKPEFQLFNRDVGRVPVIEPGERKGEFSPERFKSHGSPACLFQQYIAGVPYRRQVIHQSSGPIEKDVSDHARRLQIRPQDHQFRRELVRNPCPIHHPTMDPQAPVPFLPRRPEQTGMVFCKHRCPCLAEDLWKGPWPVV